MLGMSGSYRRRMLAAIRTRISGGWLLTLALLGLVIFLGSRLLVAFDHATAGATGIAIDTLTGRVDEIHDHVDRVLHHTRPATNARDVLVESIDSSDAFVFADEVTDDGRVQLDIVVAETANGNFATNTTATVQGCVRMTGRAGDDPELKQVDLPCPSPIPGDPTRKYAGVEITVSTGLIVH